MRSRADTTGRLLRVLRRTLLAIVGIQFALAVTMTLVDSYRRRGKKPKPFPTTRPQSVTIGGNPELLGDDASADTPPPGASRVTTYTFGEDLYEDMLAAIAGAQRRILLETYIFKGDAVGERFKQALIDAAARGVDVYVIFDSFANLVVSPRFQNFPAPIKVLRYPIYSAGLQFWNLRRYGRDHRKILVVDDDTGFVGGYNIGSAYATEWRDTHVRITGPAVWDLTRTFADFWNLNRRKRFRTSERPLLLDATSVWEPRIRFNRNNPRLWMFPIRSMYLEAIDRARHRIWMSHAYFLPDQDFVDSLSAAARRGVDVRLLLPHKSNHVVADWISRGYFNQLLEAGVRILRFRDAMVHAKTATIDGVWSTVGTANIDRLSLQGNYEINVEIIDEQFAAVMERIFEVDQGHSWELRSDEWGARSAHRKFTEFVLAPLGPLL